MIASFAAISARVFWQIWREPWYFPFSDSLWDHSGFLCPLFLSGALGAIEALIFFSCLLILVALVVFVSFFLVGLSHHTC